MLGVNMRSFLDPFRILDCVLNVNLGAGAKSGGNEIRQRLQHSAKVIIGINVVGFLITALTSTHKVTDLFVS